MLFNFMLSSDGHETKLYLKTHSTYFKYFNLYTVKRSVWLIFRNILYVIDYKQVTNLHVYVVIEKVCNKKKRRKKTQTIHAY